jgi:hypothetical protein
VIYRFIRVASFPLLKPDSHQPEGQDKGFSDLQYHEFPRLLVFVNVRPSFNVEDDEELHTAMEFSETWCFPGRL